MFLRRNLWRYTEGGAKWNYCTKGNICTQTFMDATGERNYIEFLLYFNLYILG
jgi:hypothetical protein